MDLIPYRSVGRMIARKHLQEHHTKARILRVAEEIFAQKGYYGASLSQIANKVGIAKASLLHHFPSKKVLHTSILDQAFSELDRVLMSSLDAQSDDLEKLHSLIRNYVDWIRSHPSHCRLLLREQLDNPKKSRQALDRYVLPLFRKVESFVQAGQRSGTFAPINVRVLLVQMTGSILNFFVCRNSATVLIDEQGRMTEGQILDLFQDQLMEIASRALLAKPTLSHEGRT